MVRNEVLDSFLCPLRALQYYLQATVTTRGPHNRLFIPYKQGCSSDLHANTFSSWVKQLILYVHKNASSEKLQVGKVRAHDTCALSASLALHQNMALPALLKTCTWASHNTFTNFYLRDVTVWKKAYTNWVHWCWMEKCAIFNSKCLTVFYVLTNISSIAAFMVELIQNFRLRLLYQLLPYSGDGLPLGAYSAELTNLSLSFHA